MDHDLPKKWIASFQGLRGIAILLIFISHCKISNNRFGQNRTSWFGAAGVSLFIVLSGYLLFSQLEGASINTTFIGKTIKKKFRKLYPLHIFTFLISLPLFKNMLLSPNLFVHNGITIFCNLLLIQSWFPSSDIYFSFNAVSWFLSTLVSAEIFILCLSKIIRIIKKNYHFSVILYLILAWIFHFVILLIPYPQTFNLHWLVYIFPIVRSVDFSVGGGYFPITEKFSKSVRKNY